MAKSQRTLSKQRIVQALKYIDDTKAALLSGLGPYFERFPQKKIATESILAALDAIQVVITESFSDV